MHVPSAKYPNRYWGAQPLPKTKTDFFDAITTPAPAGDGTIATIRMYGPIDSWGGFWGVSAKDVSAVLDALDGSVTQIILRINSPGGEVWEATSILNMFRAHRATVTAVVDGIAASAASYLAAGCDETVMSPGTQMMIHATSSFAFGNSAEMRKVADILDTLNAGIIEIYAAKAGEKNWVELLDEETWMTSQEAVDLGLADRVAVIPDAGEAITAGADDTEVIAVPDEDDPADSAARVIRVVAHASPIRPPSSNAEPGSTDRKETAVTNSNLAAGVRERLGVSDAAASDETLLAALDEALAEQPTMTQAPAGTVLVDEGRFRELEAAAQAGVQALATQDAARRDRIISDALADGRISAATQQDWRAGLDDNEERFATILGGLPKNKVPVEELGHSNQPENVADEQFDAALEAALKGA
jgi:ATP-dependent protease ClpP protease subunit